VSEPRTSVPAIRAAKRREGAEALVMVTAYDEPGARLADAAGVDMILVGDSVGDNVLGFADTLSVTVEMMVHHVGAVHRAAPRAMVIGDLPWMSYHVSTEQAIESAAALIRAGAGSVKLEGGVKRIPAIRAILDAEIPVMGHIGLTPQSVHAMGGHRVQGRSTAAADELLDSARALEEAGCFAIVVEGVPDALGAALTDELSIPTIGIGAGAGTDGQVLVFHDLLGLGSRTPPKFVRRYAELGSAITEAIGKYAADVRSGAFPGASESYEASSELRDHLEH
jgi:3-methyl-2-oxobutanoate hydroxymethyltransferase